MSNVYEIMSLQKAHPPILKHRLHVWLKEELRRLEAGDEGRGYQGPGGRPGASARVHVSDDGDYGASDVDFHYAADFDY